MLCEILPALFRLESRVVFTSGIDITALRGSNDQLEYSPILGDWMFFRSTASWKVKRSYHEVPLAIPLRDEILTLPKIIWVVVMKLCWHLLGELIQLDEHIFQSGWNHQLELIVVDNSWMFFRHQALIWKVASTNRRVCFLGLPRVGIFCLDPPPKKIRCEHV